jgi:hypothetical protein
MVLSNGKNVNLQQVDTKNLKKEEKIAYKNYEDSTHLTINSRNGEHFYLSFEKELTLFNKWQKIVMELNKRKDK